MAAASTISTAMIRKAALAFAVTSLLASAAFAQSASEFGRASGGEIEAIAKHSSKLSGSSDLMHGGGSRSEASVGGTLVDDRVWFFGSASRALTNGTAKIDAQPIDWNHITATYGRMEPAIETPLALPTSFLTLHSTTMFSPNAMMSFSYSQQTVK